MSPLAGVAGRETTELDHPPARELQWDWADLPGAPWGGTAHVLVGALSYSSQASAGLAESQDLAHLVEALDAVLRRFGGTARRWRFDRMATVVDPATGRVQPAFAAVAKHYQVGVDPCPPRRGHRKGVVEKAIHFLTQRWWRTARLGSAADAQASLDRFLATTRDARPRPRPGGRSVGELAEEELLRPLPIDPFPATVQVERKVTVSCTVAFRGNHYSVPPGLVAQSAIVHHRLGTLKLSVHSPVGVVLASHQLAPNGAGRTLRLPQHAAALERAVLTAFTSKRPCLRKANRPPEPEATAAARQLALLGEGAGTPAVDLDRYAELARGGDRRPPRPPRPPRRRPARPTSSSEATSTTCAWTPPPKRCPPPSTTPTPSSSATPRSWSACWRSRSKPPRPAATPAACASPPSPRPGGWKTSTSMPNPASTASWSRNSPPCGSSKSTPTAC